MQRGYGKRNQKVHYDNHFNIDDGKTACFIPLEGEDNIIPVVGCLDDVTCWQCLKNAHTIVPSLQACHDRHRAQCAERGVEVPKRYVYKMPA